jgi:hypothetical protein
MRIGVAAEVMPWRQGPSVMLALKAHLAESLLGDFSARNLACSAARGGKRRKSPSGMILAAIATRYKLDAAKRL